MNKLFIFKSGVLIFGLAIFLFTFVSAVDVSDSTSGRGVVIQIPVVPVNYSLINVNNSQYLQGLTPQQVADLYVQTDPKLNDIQNPDASHTISMGGNTLTWAFTNPIGAMFFDMTGGWSGHVLEINDSSNVPSGSAGDHLIHLETGRANVLPLHLVQRLGEIALKVEGQTKLEGNVNVTDYNVTADYLIGNGSQLTDISYTETDPIFLAENTSLWNEARNKYNATYDEWAYNQTVLGGGSGYNATYDATSKDVTANRTAWFSTYNATYNIWAYNMTVAGGGGTPGGADTQVQFNDGGSFGGDTALVWDKTNDILDITGKLTIVDSSMSDEGLSILKGGFDAAGTTSAYGAGIRVGNRETSAGDIVFGGWLAGQYDGTSAQTLTTYGLQAFAYDTSTGGNSRTDLPGFNGGLYGVRKIAGATGTIAWGANIVSRGIIAAGTITKQDEIAVVGMVKSGGTLTTQYGLHIYDLTAGATNIGIAIDGDNLPITMGVSGATDSYAKFTGTNLDLYSSGSVVIKNASGYGTIEYGQAIDHTPVLSATNFYDRLASKDNLLDEENKIIRFTEEKTNTSRTDYTKPVNTSYQVEVEAYENKSIIEEVCTYDKGLFSSTYQKSCQNVTKIVSVPKETCEQVEQCEYIQISDKDYSRECKMVEQCTPVIENVTQYKIEYPFKTSETGRDIGLSIDINRVMIAELKEKVANQQTEITNLQNSLNKLCALAPKGTC